MRFISLINGNLQLQEAGAARETKCKAITTGLEALDELMPPEGLGRGAVHEVLSQSYAAWFFAALLARSAVKEARGAVVWSDSNGELYPPALAVAIPVDRLYLLQPDSTANELWAVCQCLRCKGVGAVIASPRRLSRIEARRLQLSAEQGGGIGLVLRPASDASAAYAAATRWLVRPARGDEAAQRWDVQLIHGHGGHIGKSILLEVGRDTIDPNSVRAVDPLVHRPDQAQIARASA